MLLLEVYICCEANGFYAPYGGITRTGSMGIISASAIGFSTPSIFMGAKLRGKELKNKFF